MTFTAVSLFAGVGGFDLALENNKVKVVASVEINKHASKILNKHFPNSKLFNDVKTVTGKELLDAGFNPTNGIITGGFPCQDLSVAGKRAGLEGKRSGLFYEIVRILKETKSQYFILENVPGLLTSNRGADMGSVIGSLVELGYRISWRVLDAQHFGVPQRRKRVFIVGSLGNAGRSPEQILAISQGRTGYLEKGKQTRKSIATSATRSFRETGFADFVEDSVSRTLTVSGGALGGGSETLIVDGTRNDDVRVYEGKTMQTVVSRWGTGGNNVPLVYPMHGGMIGRQDHNGPGGSGFGNETDPSYTLTSSSMAIHGVATKQTVRRLTPIECERLQGFPDGWTEGQADGHRYKQMGNAVAVPVVSWIVSRMVGQNELD